MKKSILGFSQLLPLLFIGFLLVGVGAGTFLVNQGVSYQSMTSSLTTLPKVYSAETRVESPFNIIGDANLPQQTGLINLENRSNNWQAAGLRVANYGGAQDKGIGISVFNHPIPFNGDSRGSDAFYAENSDANDGTAGTLYGGNLATPFGYGLNLAIHKGSKNPYNSSQSVYLVTGSELRGTSPASNPILATLEDFVNGYSNTGSSHTRSINLIGQDDLIHARPHTKASGVTGVGNFIVVSDETDANVMYKVGMAGDIFTQGGVRIGANTFNTNPGTLRVANGLFFDKTDVGINFLHSGGLRSKLIGASTNQVELYMGPEGFRVMSNDGSKQFFRVTNIGDVLINGNLSATGTKNFEIDHPKKPGYKLVHAAVESPEAAVYYRGQSQLINGHASVNLPDYFETLTRKDDRTVFLTPQFDNNSQPISNLAASTVDNGSFSVRALDSNNPSQKFYWQVQAIRADIPPLEVEKKSEQVSDKN